MDQSATRRRTICPHQAALYRAITARPDMTQRLMDVLGGTASFRSLFNTRVMGILLRQSP